jgi:type IV secretory pathway VirB10-like protein
MTTDTNGTSTPSSPIQDHRPKPRGVLPRQLQMWLMVGIAVVILLIILITGHPQPVARTQAAERTTAAALPASDRIRAYQQQLKDDEARLQHVQAQAAVLARPTVPPGAPAPAATDPVADEQRRREYQSLFADNVVLSRRAAGQQPNGESGPRRGAATPASAALSPDTLAALALLTQAQAANGSRLGGPPAAPLATADGRTVSASPLSNAASTKVHEENPAAGPRLRLLEGTVIETVLLNRLDGTFAGPVECLVTTPVYSHDRQTVLIPAGARVLGTAAPVQAWGDTRLAVSFHRLIMPDGHTYSLDVFKGLGQAGETGLKDEVNRHYLQVFGASLAIGAISGLAQYGTHGIDTNSFSDAYRQSAGASLATSSSRVLDRYLNVLPTVTIREGFRIKVYLTNDFDLPAYAVTGGVQ